MGRVGRSGVVIAGLSLAMGAAVAPAYAQDVGAEFKRDRSVSVLSRPRPEYRALGILEGGFVIYPRLTLSLTGDDNVLANNADARSDGIASVQAKVAAQSDWTVNSLSGFAEFGRDDYFSEDTEDRNTYGVGMAGRYDIASDAALATELAFHRYVEPRTAEGAPQNTRRPVRYDQTSATVSGAKAFNRLRLRAIFDFDHFNYYDTSQPNGARLTQTYRDHDRFTGRLRAEYAISPDTSVFVEGVGDGRVYKPRPAIGLPIDRDSTGLRLNAGANFDWAGQARGEVNAGYFHQASADPRIPDYDGPGAATEVEFFPTPLTTVTVDVQRLVGDSGDTTAPIFVSTSVGAKLDHELLRNVILSAGLNYSHDDYEGIDRTDDRYGASARATYFMNRWLGLRVEYTYQQLRGAGAVHAQNYDINRVSFSAVLQY